MNRFLLFLSGFSSGKCLAAQCTQQNDFSSVVKETRKKKRNPFLTSTVFLPFTLSQCFYRAQLLFRFSLWKVAQVNSKALNHVAKLLLMFRDAISAFYHMWQFVFPLQDIFKETNVNTAERTMENGSDVERCSRTTKWMLRYFRDISVWRGKLVKREWSVESGRLKLNVPHVAWLSNVYHWNSALFASERSIESDVSTRFRVAQNRSSLGCRTFRHAKNYQRL